MNIRPLRDLTEEEIWRYEEDGVIHVRGLFDNDWAGLIRRACEENLDNPSPRVREAVKLGDQGRFQSDAWVCYHNDKFRQYAFDSPCAEIAAQVMRTDKTYFFYDQPFVKLPETPAETAWHNDLPFWPFKRAEGICSLWMAANDFGQETSGLEFVRGSHKWDKWYLAVTHDRDPAFMQTDLPECPNFSELRDEYDVVAWDMQAGDVLIFNTLIVHGSGGNPSKTTPRYAHSTRWLADHAIWDPRPATVGALMPNVDHLPAGQSIAQEIFRDTFPQVYPNT